MLESPATVATSQSGATLSRLNRALGRIVARHMANLDERVPGWREVVVELQRYQMTPEDAAQWRAHVIAARKRVGQKRSESTVALIAIFRLLSTLPPVAKCPELCSLFRLIAEHGETRHAHRHLRAIQ